MSAYAPDSVSHASAAASSAVGSCRAGFVSGAQRTVRGSSHGESYPLCRSPRPLSTAGSTCSALGGSGHSGPDSGHKVSEKVSVLGAPVSVLPPRTSAYRASVPARTRAMLFPPPCPHPLRPAPVGQYFLQCICPSQTLQYPMDTSWDILCRRGTLWSHRAADGDPCARAHRIASVFLIEVVCNPHIIMH